MWLDGEKMKAVIKRLWGYEMADLPKLVVQHTKSMRYWVPQDDEAFPSLHNAWAFLGDVQSGKISSRGGKGFMGMVSR